jgi:hypothetical protein
LVADDRIGRPGRRAGVAALGRDHPALAFAATPSVQTGIRATNYDFWTYYDATT